MHIAAKRASRGFFLCYQQGAKSHGALCCFSIAGAAAAAATLAAAPSVVACAMVMPNAFISTTTQDDVSNCVSKRKAE